MPDPYTPDRDFFPTDDRPHLEPRSQPAPTRRTTPPKPRPAVEQEADPIEEETTPIDWSGVTLHVPQSDDMDMDVIESFEDGKVVQTLRRVFGDKPFAAARRDFETLNGHRPKVRDLNALVEAVLAVWGFTPGE